MKALNRFIGVHLGTKPSISVKTTSRRVSVHKMSDQPNVPLPSTFNDSRPQPFHAYKDGVWQESSGEETPAYDTHPPIKLLSWNIDFQAPHGRKRMEGALNYLQQLIGSMPPETPSIILLQEMTGMDLLAIQDADWVQKHFHITDIDYSHWLSHYGTITLIDRRLKVSSVFRVRYSSGMGRDALFVDIEDARPMTLRFCNTHLESLPRHPPLRPGQVELASRYLKDSSVGGGVIAGDFNAIEEFDKTLHSVNGLKDAWLDNGGVEDDESGWTWGMQSHPGVKERFGCLRLDKILYCGRVSVRNVERIGAGVSVEEKWVHHYVTDHLGLMADVIVEDAT